MVHSNHGLGSNNNNNKIIKYGRNVMSRTKAKGCLVRRYKDTLAVRLRAAPQRDDAEKQSEGGMSAALMKTDGDSTVVLHQTFCCLHQSLEEELRNQFLVQGA